MLEMISRLLCFAMPLSLALAGVFDNDKYPMEKGKHNIDTGTREDGDESLYSETLRESGRPMRHIGNEYCYPPKGSTDQVKITEYEIKDLDNGNDGGLAFDVSGGVGKNQVCFFLKTQKGKGYNFKVDIYGRRIGRNVPLGGGDGHGAVRNVPLGGGDGNGAARTQPFGSGSGIIFGGTGNGYGVGPNGKNLGGKLGGPGTGNIGQQGNFGAPNTGSFVPPGRPNSNGGPFPAAGYGMAGGYGSTAFPPNNVGYPVTPSYDGGNGGFTPNGSGNVGFTPNNSGNTGLGQSSLLRSGSSKSSNPSPNDRGSSESWVEVPPKRDPGECSTGMVHHFDDE